MSKPTPQSLQQMLDDIESVTQSRFYADPDPIASPVEMFRIPEDKPGGELFSALSPEEKFQVLGDYTDWQEYDRNGIGMESLDQIFANVIVERPRSAWLDGVELSESEGRPQSFDDLLREASNRRAVSNDEEIER